MNFFNEQIPRFLAHLPEDTDHDTSDTEDDSGIADETETETDRSPSALLTPEMMVAQFPDLKITDPLSVQNHALDNFFQYWWVGWLFYVNKTT